MLSIVEPTLKKCLFMSPMLAVHVILLIYEVCKNFREVFYQVLAYPTQADCNMGENYSMLPSFRTGPVF